VFLVEKKKIKIFVVKEKLKLGENIQVKWKLRLLRRKKMMKDFLFQGIFRVGVCALHTLGHHVDWKVQSHGLIKRLGKRMLKLRKKMLGSWVSP
jgi:hypothetical protein